METLTDTSHVYICYFLYYDATVYYYRLLYIQFHDQRTVGIIFDTLRKPMDDMYLPWRDEYTGRT